MKLYRIAILTFLIFVGCTQQQEVPSREHPSEPQDDPANTPVRSVDVDRKTSSVGQLIYVPVYSHIYQQDRKKTFSLTTTLSIRNADPQRSFRLLKVSYYDSRGKLVQQYLDSEQEIKPLASTSFVVEERDLRGGVGANFMVDWRSGKPVVPPVVEAVNISTSQQQGISFLSIGRVVQEHKLND